MRRASVAACVFVCALARPANALVRLRPVHAHTFFGLTGTLLESYGFERSARSNVLGGGLVFGQDMSGGWPFPWSNGPQNLNWAYLVRARYLESFDADRHRASLPIDAIVRISRRRFPRELSYLDNSGWPTQVEQEDPLVPYVGIGATLDLGVVPEGGKSRVGALAVGGIERWFGRRVGLYTELELRGVVLGGGAVQAGVNAGLLVAL
jgi:hypothetical protein